VERPERILALYFRLTESGLVDKLTKIEVAEISDEVLLAVHTKLFVNKVEDIVNDTSDPLDAKPLASRVNSFSFSADTYENRWTPYCARLAAGGVIEVIDAVYDDTVKRAFCIVRPPGHHAHSSMASGFCFYNNVALAAKYAQRKHKAAKVCIFDWDVHYGDGTS
jgi:histone deacetylase 6